MKARNKLARTLSLCAFFLPAGYLFFLVRRYGVDVPYLEQWNVAFLFEKLSRGALTAADLFEQQNEYRQFFPHLLLVGVGRLTGWNVKYDLCLVFLLACLISVCVYRLGALTLEDAGGLRRAAAFFLTNLLLFSPMQYENWLYGIQVVYLLPVACVVAGVLVAQTRRAVRTKFLLCGCLALVATFSAANGMLAWPVLLPPLLLSEPRAGLKERRWLTAVWLVCAALSVAVYLHGLRSTPEHPSMFEALRHPARAAAFFFSLLGTPLWAGSPWVTISLGVALVAVYALAFVYVWKHREDGAPARRMTGWLALGAFSLLSGAMITAGRSGFGIGQANAGRYIAFSLYLTAAIAHLLPLLACELKRRGHAERARIVGRLAALTFVLAVAAQARLYPIGTLSMMYKWREHAHEKACMLFVNVLPGECPSERGLPAGLLRRGANALDRVGYLRPPLIRGARLEEIEAGASEAAGVFEELKTEPDGSLSAAGHARIPGKGRPADAVLLAYDKGEAGSFVFALGEAGAEKEYSISRLREIVSPSLRWRARVPAGVPGGGPLKINAWALDAEEGKAYRLAGSHAAR